MGSSTLRKKILCHVVDEIAYRDPEKLFCIHPISSDITQGWRRVTLANLADAVNYTAQWIVRTVGPASEDEHLAYMGANDIRYAAFTLACMKTGHSVLLLSPRNSTAGSLRVLHATKSFKFIYSVERRKLVEALQQTDKSLHLWEIPSLWDIFNKKVDPYPCNTQYTNAEDKAAVIIHSSGTTGFPKPVPLTNGFLSAIDNMPQLPIPSGRRSSLISMVKPGALFFTMAPFFHLMGYFTFLESIYHGTPFISDETNPVNALLTPSILEDFGSSEAGLNLLRRFETIFFGGAPLSPDIGNKLCQDTNLQALIGSSEAGFISSLVPADMKDWEWFDWNPFNDVDMQYVEDGLFEMVLRRKETRDFSGIFHTFPDIDTYRTKDLYAPHPTRPGLWRYRGRFDDVIVLSNGEKFNPIEMEKIIEGHPYVSKALVVGQKRFQPALLIEPNWQELPAEEHDDANGWLIDRIWPTVEKSNEIAPGHGQLLKAKIGMASKSKPFKTTPKGTVQRQLVLADYADEIDEIYNRISDDEEGISNLPLELTLQNVTQYVQQVLSHLLKVDKQVPETADIFSLGLDSLQTLQLSKILQGAVGSLRPDHAGPVIIPAQKLYSYSSVASISQYVYGLANGGDASVEVDGHHDSTRSQRIAALIEKYTEDLPEKQVGHFHRLGKYAVILSGSTGSLGNYILNELILDPEISKIYCLNRSEDAEKRQIRSFEEKGLGHLSSRVEFLRAKFGAEKLGLSDHKYEELKDSVDTIIHNAWKVNFNHKLETFEDTHIEGVRRLIDFSLDSTHSAHIHFISSISTVGGWTAAHGPSVPEVPLEDPQVALEQGYGESKFVSERISAIASARSGVPTSLFRVGQIGGPTTEKGVWNRQEWLPAMIATSKTLQKIPTEIGSMPVDWIPVDSLAKIIVDVTRSRRITDTTERTAAFNLVNPIATPWMSLVPPIQARYSVEPVEFGAWLDAVEAFSNPTQADFQDKPALKILEFFRGLHEGHGDGKLSPPMQTARTQAASKTMRTLSSVDATLMENWLRQWNF
ncbi:uncharacterized protein TRUGW13939_08668 [Talaromyces rugulosus]|uniref:Carrier domain-containing protein n=1 Tax=Talaromyces rugulosus TaxID=121627 RepID=A0A7H8R5Q6_TALRU|nr:uncharacterized protein TRUGW13939_08668 [Talaromyces rugulosus]QKX61516.1 hypothetical protein TRUGW13939_08668 [Talaromyces rugulosus]